MNRPRRPLDRPCPDHDGRPDQRVRFERAGRDRHRQQQRRRQHPRNRAQAVKFAECMRSNGVSQFPDPGASGKLTIDAVANGSSLDTSTPAFKQALSACKALEPAGFTGSKRSSQQQQAAPQVRPVHPRQRRDDFPDPIPNGPLVDTNRIPSAADNRRDERSPRRDAEVQRCSSRSGGHAVRRKTWVLAAAAVLAAVTVTGGVLVMSGAKRQALAAAAGAAGEHRAGGEEDALGDGLRGRDPDLSGAVGRLAVLGDQPGPRDIHQAARGRPGDLSGSRALPGQRSARWCCCMARHPPIGPCRPGRPAPTWPSSTRIWSRSATPPRLSFSRGPPSSGRPPPRPWRSSRPPLGVTQNGTLALGQAVFEPTAVRVTSRVSPARGQRPARRDGAAGHLDHSPGAGGVGRLATDRRGGRGQGEHHPAQQPDHPGCRLLGGGGRHLPIELRVRRVGIQLRCAGNGHLLVSELGEQPRRPSPWTSPPPTRPPRARGIRPRCRSASPPPACPTRWWCR